MYFLGERKRGGEMGRGMGGEMWGENDGGEREGGERWWKERGGEREGEKYLDVFFQGVLHSFTAVHTG